MAKFLSSEENSRIEALKTRHSEISDRLEKAQKRPATADYYLKQLKKQKLMIKDTIESLSIKSANESHASEERA